MTPRETHMSWVFLTQNEVYKLKKPVRFPYLDYSSLSRRLAVCRAEIDLNRRLAPDVYIGLTPLTQYHDTLAIDGLGRVVDWLVVMRRLDERQNLESLLLCHRLAPTHLDSLATRLLRFYRSARRAVISPTAYVERWRRNLAENRRILLDRRLGLPAATLRHVDRHLTDFLIRRSHLLTERVHQRLIVDGHGDLRPEHIWPQPPVRIIDCLEFSAELRMVDPLDELAFLYVECSRLGAAHHGAYVVRRVARALPGGLSPELFTFYASYRAMLRARLAVAHLLEPWPRTPEKWLPLASAYLRIAERVWRRLAATEGPVRA